MFYRLDSYLQELKLLGVQGSIFRTFYEISLRSGLKERFDRKITVPPVDLTLAQWRKEKKACFFPSFSESHKVLSALLSPENQHQVVDRAEKALAGEIRCFSSWVGKYGQPANWHLNPQRNIPWPPNVHYSKIMNFEGTCGDIKLAWEINRFPHLFDLGRAYALTGNEKYVIAFRDQLQHWNQSNAYGYGINWHNGQELAIRLAAWIFAFYLMSDSENFTENDFQQFLKLLYLHSKHIARNINYAYYAVHNNHLIGESLALFMSGVLFPYFPESSSWVKKGKALLEGKRCIKQFFPDGGYCQLSFNYQRLAIHYYLWALLIAESNKISFPRRCYDILEQSRKFLISFLNREDGKLPNWGANDGALFNPWTSCDYPDFRPLLNSLSYLHNQKRCFPRGIWDEELFWFFGEKSLDSPVESIRLKSNNYPYTGLHVIRSDENNFAALRCGSVTDRFGQADQLHVDIWWKGINIAVDGGSYLYNDETQYHRFFMGTRSHNTIIIDAADQMRLHRRFKWLDWTKARLIKFSEKNVMGEHYGYRRMKGKITHQRSLTLLDKDTFLIEDSLIQERGCDHDFDLHWLLNDFPYTFQKLGEGSALIALDTRQGTYYLVIKGNRDAILTINKAQHDPSSPDGWQSRYYARKDPALSVHLQCRSNQGGKFFSLFTPDKNNISIPESD